MQNKDGGEGGWSGIYAAVITPVDERELPDPDGLERLLDFVLQRGVDGICLGGATGEYPRFTIEQRKTIVETAARHVAGSVPFVTAIGAPTMHGVLELGDHALEHGSRSLMLPMPYFYRYGQQDLRAYAREAARTLGAPCLLYNLAAFTNPLEPDTSLELLRNEPNLVGIKDSSGDRAALERLAGGRRTPSDYALLCGSDGLLLEALEAGWDGAISGIASCAPELISALYAHVRRDERSEAVECMARLDELTALVNRLPFPWSLRVACEVRGLPAGPMPWPLAPERKADIDRLRRDYSRWFDENIPSDELIP